MMDSAVVRKIIGMVRMLGVCRRGKMERVAEEESASEARDLGFGGRLD